MTLDWQGKTFYFISVDPCRAFETRHGISSK
jgi:hypothetical protein